MKPVNMPKNMVLKELCSHGKAEAAGEKKHKFLHLNPLTGKWGNDYSSLQRHVSLAIAFNIWQYFNITGDKKFIEEQGLEMFLEICRFWASKCDFNEKTGKYSISKVMGPDEFHEKYKNSKEGGLKDNTYTNLMVELFLDFPQLQLFSFHIAYNHLII